MERKHVLGGLAAATLVIGLIAYPKAKWGIYAMAVDETVLKLPRFATAEQVLTLDDQLLDVAAQRYGYDKAALQVALSFEAKDMGPGGVWWYVQAVVKKGSSEIKATPRRVEGGIPPEYLQALEEGGVTVRRPVPAPGAAGGDGSE